MKKIKSIAKYTLIFVLLTLYNYYVDINNIYELLLSIILGVGVIFFISYLFESNKKKKI
ncbi:hypothetical protein [Priestia megaterium]|uniref:hypothetical protein n=1 Tax=Priestia megaterium TaxID=1404 RepID=UPI0015E0A59B|nr:hypothetical protein [Priestia megaterium]